MHLRMQGICRKRVWAVFFIVTDASSFLFGYVGTAVNRTGRNADDAIKSNAMFHEYIQYTGGVDATLAAAF